MKYKIKILLVLLVLAQINIIVGQEFKTVKDIVSLNKEIGEVAQNTQTITADFVQEKHLDFLDVVVESNGIFIYKAPQKLRWEYVSPYKYLVLMNEGKFSIIQNNNVKEIDLKSSESFQEINNLMINSIKGDILTDPNFETTVLESKTVYKVILKPKDKKVNKVINTIEVLINKQTKTVDQLIMFESETDYTLIKFKNKQINKEVNDSRFRK